MYGFVFLKLQNENAAALSDLRSTKRVEVLKTCQCSVCAKKEKHIHGVTVHDCDTIIADMF